MRSHSRHGVHLPFRPCTRICCDTCSPWCFWAGRRLRDEVSKLNATVGCPGTDTAASARGEAARRAAMVLSELLSQADARAGELAAAFDRARVAGLACESSYDHLVE
ncbi:DUF2514 domain-containing protein [Pseudomonas xantholysinigenes]|uniref:DUF2514 domain-containing protein n=1 Tax=Pseudomonas xantholysinigenes TaxID=2745490 RepID=A0A9E6U0C0_9PSED|nr:DUF2514 domain-containing protein [Pseudomonas xantholysinigenes]